MEKNLIQPNALDQRVQLKHPQRNLNKKKVLVKINLEAQEKKVEK
jgi:hypothetical protein